MLWLPQPPQPSSFEIVRLTPIAICRAAANYSANQLCCRGQSQRGCPEACRGRCPHWNRRLLLLLRRYCGLGWAKTKATQQNVGMRLQRTALPPKEPRLWDRATRQTGV